LISDAWHRQIETCNLFPALPRILPALAGIGGFVPHDDGSILVGGRFSATGGQPRHNLARLLSAWPAR
jgi:hypothetical protein